MYMLCISDNPSSSLYNLYLDVYSYIACVAKWQCACTCAPSPALCNAGVCVLSFQCWYMPNFPYSLLYNTAVCHIHDGTKWVGLTGSMRSGEWSLQHPYVLSFQRNIHVRICVCAGGRGGGYSWSSCSCLCRPPARQNVPSARLHRQPCLHKVKKSPFVNLAVSYLLHKNCPLCFMV